MSKGVSIKYNDIAVNAKENFDIQTSEDKFGTASQLSYINSPPNNYASPCEYYNTLLDGSAIDFPEYPLGSDIGLWSEQLSSDNGVFATPLSITLSAAGQYSSQGFTFTFDTFNNIFCNDLNITWYRDNAQIDTSDFTPNSAEYFCKKKVDNFDKVIITFKGINMPKNRLKISVIDYGYSTYFYGDELQNVSVNQSIDPISSQILISTVDFNLYSKRDTEYSFQAKQPLFVYFNDKLLATTFIKTSKRNSKYTWQISSEDYIGLLDSVQYYGDIYTSKNAVEILSDIFNVAKVPYLISDSFANNTVSGHIPYTSCRNALMQVCFAIQAVVDTSNSNVIKIIPLDDDIKQTIPLNRIMQGQSFENDTIVTQIQLISHTYKAITENFEAYNSNNSGTGEDIFVQFSEPLHDLSITNGTIVSSSANYAFINANENCILTGEKYEHSIQPKSKKNPLVLKNDVEKIIRIDSATLISPSNIDNVLDKCYNCLIKTDSVNLNIVEGKHNINNNITYDKAVNLGDKITTKTEYLGDITGRIIKQSFNLNGNIIVKDVVLK